ncbi:MAG: Clp protease N-terminal domain-containing protein [Isosphaerales bacterium]
MDSNKWHQRPITDSAQRILKQIPPRASERGLHVVDGASIVKLALWSVLLWERKVGLVALERSGANRFDLVRGLDLLLEEKASEHPVAYDKQRGVLVLVKTDLPYDGWDFDALLEPLLRQAEHEAKDLMHNYVGSEHLVLAIVELADPALRVLLQQHGVSHKQVKEAVVSLLHP